MTFDKTAYMAAYMRERRAGRPASRTKRLEAFALWIHERMNDKAPLARAEIIAKAEEAMKP